MPNRRTQHQSAAHLAVMTSRRSAQSLRYRTSCRKRSLPWCARSAQWAVSGLKKIVWNGAECTVAGTGYTGEAGLEVSIPSGDAAELWHALAEAGATPAGLGARDTLRLEAGLPLHGQELGPDITPLQAGLGWVVAFDTKFIGKDALLAEKASGPSRRLVGIATEGRRPPRTGNPIVCDGEEIGHVTSGNFHRCFSTGLRWALSQPIWPSVMRLPSTFAAPKCRHVSSSCHSCSQLRRAAGHTPLLLRW